MGIRQKSIQTNIQPLLSQSPITNSKCMCSSPILIYQIRASSPA